MNYIWGGMILISIITSVFTGRIDVTVNSIFEGASTAVTTLISFAGAMCFWTGIMKIAEKTGISKTLCRIISPIINFLFPGCSQKAKSYISMNVTANILGMGNAATPMGMLASEELDRENNTPDHPSDPMCMLIVLNTTSFQLIPTTIIAMRAASGSVNPVSVIVPIWFASAVSVIIGVISVKLWCRIKRRV